MIQQFGLKWGHLLREIQLRRDLKPEVKPRSHHERRREILAFDPGMAGRAIRTVFVHCSASDNPDHDNIETIRRWHVQGQGWSDIGYHWVITKDGELHIGRPARRYPAGQKGHNVGTLAICLTGLREFTEDQFDTLRELCRAIDDAYPHKLIRFRGHCEVSRKRCPVFDYGEVLGLDVEGHRMPRRDKGADRSRGRRRP